MDVQLSFTMNANSFAVSPPPCKVVTGGVGGEDDTRAFAQIGDTIVPPGLQPGSVSQARLSELTLPNIGVKSCECVTGVCERAPERPPGVYVSTVRAQADPLTELGASCNFHS